eukprot:6469609-Prymnesium_polylepis.1
MAPRAPAAEHLEAELGAQPHLQVARIPVGSVAQRFEYERESRLELLRVTCRGAAGAAPPRGALREIDQECGESLE